MGDSRAALRSNQAAIQARKKALGWRKGDNWKSERGGFNPDVFDDLDSNTRKRLREHRIGPPNMKGDKLDVNSALTVNQWSDGGNYGPPLPYGLNELRNKSDEGRQGTNRGLVQNAVWEMGLSGIKTKEDLNRFLDRTEELKAEHGDFDWGPEATMLFRSQPAAKEATAPQEAAPAAPTNAQPSSQLLAARDKWDRFQGGGSIPFNPTGDGILDAATYGNRATDDYVNRFAPGLNAEAGFAASEMSHFGAEQLNRFQGEPSELASSDIKDLYKYYSKQISGIA